MLFCCFEGQGKTLFLWILNLTMGPLFHAVTFPSVTYYIVYTDVRKLFVRSLILSCTFHYRVITAHTMEKREKLMDFFGSIFFF